MIIEYVGVSEINGSLIVLDGVKGASYEEIVTIKLADGSARQGRIVQIEVEHLARQHRHHPDRQTDGNAPLA